AEVRGCPLAGLMGDQVLVEVEVEGDARQVLAAIEATLDQPRPPILLEVDLTRSPSDRITGTLRLAVPWLNL
ncbi:MAG: hypothetical protein AB1758_15560, partial [Candidatus Eremiobacterota bacterium]